MQNVEAMEFFEEVVDDSDDDDIVDTTVLEHKTGKKLEVNIVQIERNELLDELNALPEDMLEVLAGADGTDEAQEEAEERGMVSAVSGDTARAFESICAKGLEHPQLTSKNMEMMVSKFDFPVLFGLGLEVLEASFEDTGSITDFHAPDSDENSS
jgi:hypothetical protein